MSAPFDAFADERRWVAWRNEERAGKLTKVPYGVGGKPAKANDPNTWLTRVEAIALAKRITNGLGGGIGLELGDIGADLRVSGIDLDSCLEDGNIAPWAAAILDVVQSYAETSPSKTGVKAFFYVEAGEARPFLDRIGATHEQWGVRRTAPGHDGKDHGPAVEIYLGFRYFAVTGDRWPSAPDRLVLLDRATLERLIPLIPVGRQGNGAAQGNKAADNSRSAAAFRKARAFRRQYPDGTFEEMVAALQADPDTQTWVRDKGVALGNRELRRIWEKAAVPTEEPGEVSLDDFWAYMPKHEYIFAPTRDMWPAISVNTRLSPKPKLNAEGKQEVDSKGKPLWIRPSDWLDENRSVEQMTWCPGHPLVIDDRLVAEGGWIDRRGVRTFNLYREPIIEPGDPDAVQPWLDLVHKVYPDDAVHIISWFAHRVQRPAEKINHALVMGGLPGIGKDTVIEPVKRAVGHWNFAETSPVQVMEKFTGFLKSVIMRISEARDLGEFDRFKFYDHTKVFIASPPDVVRVNEKHLREHAVFNVTGVIITTNHKTDGIYLPREDRRHYVAWSELTTGDFESDYWRKIYDWYDSGGAANVAAYLRQFDLSGFEAKAPPLKTKAFWEIVEASHPPEDGELADAIDELGKIEFDKLVRPKVVTIQQLVARNSYSSFGVWLQDRKNSRVIPHRFEKCGYTRVRNESADDGLWKVGGKRQAIYGRADLSIHDRYQAATEMVAQNPKENF
jgi:hypothetical protein